MLLEIPLSIVDYVNIFSLEELLQPNIYKHMSVDKISQEMLKYIVNKRSCKKAILTD